MEWLLLSLLSCHTQRESWITHTKELFSDVEKQAAETVISEGRETNEKARLPGFLSGGALHTMARGGGPGLRERCHMGKKAEAGVWGSWGGSEAEYQKGGSPRERGFQNLQRGSLVTPASTRQHTRSVQLHEARAHTAKWAEPFPALMQDWDTFWFRPARVERPQGTAGTFRRPPNGPG